MKNHDENRARIVAMASGALVFFLGAWLCWLIPERSLAWVLAMLTLPAAWWSQQVLQKIGVDKSGKSPQTAGFCRSILGHPRKKIVPVFFGPTVNRPADYQYRHKGSPPRHVHVYGRPRIVPFSSAPGTSRPD